MRIMKLKKGKADTPTKGMAMKTITTAYGKVKAEKAGKANVHFGAYYARNVNIYKDEQGRMFGRICYEMREIKDVDGTFVADTESHDGCHIY